MLVVADDLNGLYARFGRWVKPGGWMSHQTDFVSCGVTRQWNGHLRFGETAWKIVRGRRPFFVNRFRLSTHLELLQRNGFDVVEVLKSGEPGGLERSRLAPRWRAMSDEDFYCAHAFIVARKRQ